MKKRLTIKLEAKLIKRAKMYAKKNDTSLSKLIETYLGFLSEMNDENEVTPLVKSLSGMLTLPKDFDGKKNHKRHLVNKYSK